MKTTSILEPAVLAWLGQVAAWEIHGPQWRLSPLTSGAKGIHLYIPLNGSHAAATISRLAQHELAKNKGCQTSRGRGDGVLQYAGRVGSGFSGQALMDIAGRGSLPA